MICETYLEILIDANRNGHGSLKTHIHFRNTVTFDTIALDSLLIFHPKQSCHR